MGTHNHTFVMNTHKSLIFALNLSIFNANVIISEKSAKLRLKRAMFSSNVNKECFSNKFCTSFEEFAEGAENVEAYKEKNITFGKKTKILRTREGFKNLDVFKAFQYRYLTCHMENLSCAEKSGKKCVCNKSFRKWLKNPSLSVKPEPETVTDSNDGEWYTTEKETYSAVSTTE